MSFRHRSCVNTDRGLHTAVCQIDILDAEPKKLTSSPHMAFQAGAFAVGKLFVVNNRIYNSRLIVALERFTPRFRF